MKAILKGSFFVSIKSNSNLTSRFKLTIKTLNIKYTTNYENNWRETVSNVT